MARSRDGAATLREIFAAALDSQRLSATELRLWLVVRSYDGGDGCYASTTTLAGDLELSPSYVEKMRASLKNRGWLQVRHRGPKEPALQATIPEALHSSDEQEPEALHQSEEQTAKALQLALHHSANRIRGIRKHHISARNVLELLERYSEDETKLIDRAISAFASTRKRGKLSVTIVEGELEYWEGFEREDVLAGLRIYLEKGCAEEGKDEKYARGIIRNDPQKQWGGGSGGNRISRSPDDVGAELSAIEGAADE